MSGDDGPSSSDDEPPAFVQYGMDIVGSAGAVILVGLLLFTVSGVWPPLVAIESPSMDPHIEKGDLVFVMEEERFAGPNDEGGVVTAAAADGYVKFQQPGDVIVYEPDGDASRTPIIHRAMFYVEDGENWYSRADPDHVGSAENCTELSNCPADHRGFITMGDNNNQYDQVGATPISEPVEPQWVIGTAEYRVPLLGEIRLGWNRAGTPGAVVAG
ncbi:S26 family signal peptidase [Haloarcula onubensis]|uniref:S26 family signal peptidase n=1 Tax=Haloarcula onubensis TaxID=2950539 RepID=A0ABU2FQ75_9EURY|nr:S26 family signal peptidase [Halomicroarcula sp. S3CR25-11]MDS0282574.1 S26 family signal peptidase [Halomicroarcula sp. S3CR25-11]